MSDPNIHRQRRAELLDTAKGYVNNERNTSYNEPTVDFERIAGAWEWWSSTRDPNMPIGPVDVSAMMILMKLSRIAGNPTHEDSWVDIAGYAACGLDVALTDDEADEKMLVFIGKHLDQIYQPADWVREPSDPEDDPGGESNPFAP